MDVENLFLVLIEPAFSPPLDIIAIIAAITPLRPQLSGFLFEFVHWWGNKVADMVAKFCLRNVLPFDWLMAASPELASLL